MTGKSQADGVGSTVQAKANRAASAARAREAKAKKRRTERKPITADELPDKTEPAPQFGALPDDHEAIEWMRARNANTAKMAAVPSSAVLPVTYELRRPEDGEFFRVHPTQQCYVWLHERKYKVRSQDEKPFYLVDEGLVPKFRELRLNITRFLIMRAVSMTQVEFLIPVPVDSNLGHAPSIRQYVETAKMQWIRVVTEKKGCSSQPADNQDALPVFHPVIIERMIMLTFVGAHIQSENDEMMKVLRGAAL
jgi:hypothetical protein